jgi:hypothetical protein
MAISLVFVIESRRRDCECHEPVKISGILCTLLALLAPAEWAIGIPSAPRPRWMVNGILISVHPQGRALSEQVRSPRHIHPVTGSPSGLYCLFSNITPPSDKTNWRICQSGEYMLFSIHWLVGVTKTAMYDKSCVPFVCSDSRASGPSTRVALDIHPLLICLLPWYQHMMTFIIAGLAVLLGFGLGGGTWRTSGLCRRTFTTTREAEIETRC